MENDEAKTRELSNTVQQILRKDGVCPRPAQENRTNLTLSEQWSVRFFYFSVALEAVVVHNYGMLISPGLLYLEKRGETVKPRYRNSWLYSSSLHCSGYFFIFFKTRCVTISMSSCCCA